MGDVCNDSLPAGTNRYGERRVVWNGTLDGGFLAGPGLYLFDSTRVTRHNPETEPASIRIPPRFSPRPARFAPRGALRLGAPGTDDAGDAPG